MTRYYTLLSREPGLTHWSVCFGDYDRRTVADEMVELTISAEDDGLDTEFRIICTDEHQSAIDAKVAELNADLDARIALDHTR